MESTQIKAAVKEQYGKVAKGEATCGSLCGCTDNAEGLAITFGYSAGRAGDAARGGEPRPFLRQSASGGGDAGRAKPCSTWAVVRDSIASWLPARSGRPAG